MPVSPLVWVVSLLPSSKSPGSGTGAHIYLVEAAGARLKSHFIPSSRSFLHFWLDSKWGRNVLAPCGIPGYLHRSECLVYYYQYREKLTHWPLLLHRHPQEALRIAVPRREADRGHLFGRMREGSLLMFRPTRESFEDPPLDQVWMRL